MPEFYASKCKAQEPKHKATPHSFARCESLEELEKMIEMGFKEGFTVTLNELTGLLKTLKK